MPCGCSARALDSQQNLMEILYLLIPLSVVLVLVIAALFWWTIDNGQFDDLEGPAHRVIMDDDGPETKPEQDS